MDAQQFRKALKQACSELKIRDIAVTTEEDISQLEKRGLSNDQAKFIADRGLRKPFRKLADAGSPLKAFKVLESFNRHGGLELEAAEEIVERAETETHIQRLVEAYAEEGELPEREELNLDSVVETVVDENPEAVEDLEEGNDSAVNYLIGQVMQKTNGKADAAEAKEKIRDETGF